MFYPAEKVVNFMKERKDLNYHTKFNPINFGTLIATTGIEQKLLPNEQLEDKFVALYSSIITKIAGISSPFSKESDRHKGVTLSSQITKVAMHTALDLIQDPKMQKLNTEALIDFGKNLGKSIRDDLYKNRSLEAPKLKEALEAKLHYIQNNTTKDLLREALQARKKATLSSSAIHGEISSSSRAR